MMKALNKYYPSANEFQGEMKIKSAEEYSASAKMFSHRLRSFIKESYEAYHGSMEGIRLTLNNEQFIYNEIESHFGNVPAMRTGRK